MKQMTLSLDINEVNIIIKALSERPFREVYELIGKIHSQSSGQVLQNNNNDKINTSSTPKPHEEEGIHKKKNKG